jgi:predicted site-specific integrase-resolvase
MQYVTVNGKDYVHIQTLAEALNVSTATIYNWRRAGHIDFCWPLGRVMTFVTRETAEKLRRLSIVSAVGAFVRSERAVKSS